MGEEKPLIWFFDSLPVGLHGSAGFFYDNAELAVIPSQDAFIFRQSIFNNSSVNFLFICYFAGIIQIDVEIIANEYTRRKFNDKKLQISKMG